MFLGIYLILLSAVSVLPSFGKFARKIDSVCLIKYTRAYDFALFPLSILAGYGIDAMSRPLHIRGHSYAHACHFTI